MLRFFIATIMILWLLPQSAFPAVFHTAMTGDDSNPGSESLPWRTVQKAANTLQPGDSVIVGPGDYAERVMTATDGAPNASVTFIGLEGATVRGFKIQHLYITVSGFNITGWSASSTTAGYVEVTSAGDFFEMSNCHVRDGIQTVRTDMVFDSSQNALISSTGGFLEAGFAPGQTLYVGAATNGLSFANSGLHTILSVSDNSIITGIPLVDEGPLPIYLSASFVYGLVLRTGSENCLIRNNTFRNLGYDVWFIMGSGHHLENNTIEQVNGWDAMHFGGSDHVFRGNLIRNSPLTVYQNSPDALENYSPNPYARVLFTNNFIQGFAGVLASQKGENQSTGLVFSRNVFVDVGRFIATHPETTFEHNTFLRVAKTNTPVTSVAKHPILIQSSLGATNIVIRNNVFVDCGQPTTSVSSEQVGWYEISGLANSITAEGNFVAGAPISFAAKTTWPESDPLLNGGDPGFVDIDDPLGPDGVPFTHDDGLRLFPDSKLILAGPTRTTLGAHEVIYTPRLDLTLKPDGLLQISWNDSRYDYVLQTADSPDGSWVDFIEPITSEGGLCWITVSPVESTSFFRLRP